MQTTARSLPSCRASSTHSRSSLAMDPWCIAKIPAHSGLWAKSAWYHTSACLRVLVKINVLSCDSTTWATSSINCKPMCPAQGRRAKALGMVLSTSTTLGMSALINVPCDAPVKAFSAPSASANVALTPHTNVFLFSNLALWRNQDTANSTWTPRFDPSNSCHSSTTTICALDNRSAPPFWAIKMCNDSGVVIKMSGSTVRWRALSFADVSPVLVPTSQSRPKPCTMSRAASAMSAESALNGATQISFTPRVLSWAADAFDKTWPMAAYVLPLPVGACNSPSSPRPQAAHTSNWNA